MTLRNSSSNLAMAITTVKRHIWLLVIAVIGFCFALPVSTAISLQRMESFIQSAGEQGEFVLKSAYEDVAESLLSTFHDVTAVLIIVGAILAGTVFFVYLTNRKKIDFYHSLPIKRRRLFTINYLAGIIVFLLPFIVGTILNTIIIAILGFGEHVVWGNYLLICLKAVLAYFCLYSLMVLAVTLCGTTLMSLLLFAIFNGFTPVVLALGQTFKVTFYNTYWHGYFPIEEWYSYTSPFINTVDSNTSAIMLLLLAVIGIVAVFLGILCYEKRQSEVAGQSLAFNNSKLIVKIPLSLLGTFAFAFIFYELGNQQLFWLYFGAVTGAVIICQFLNIWIQGEFSAVKKGWISVLAVALIAVATLTYTANDMGDFDSYLPQAEEVESVQLDMRDVIPYPQNYYMTSSEFDEDYEWGRSYSLDIVINDPETVAAVLALAENGIANIDLSEPVNEDVPDDLAVSSVGEDTNYASIGIVYNLTNGQTECRYYDSINVDEMEEALKTVIDDKEFNDNYAQLTQLESNQIYIENIQSFNNQTVYGREVDEDTQRALVNAYLQDYKNLTADNMANEIPIGYISFVMFTNSEDMPSGQAEALSYEVLTYDSPYAFCAANYPIYPSFENTLSIIYANHGSNFFDYNLYDIENITVQYPLDYTENGQAIINEELVQELYNKSLLKDTMGYEDFRLNYENSSIVISDPEMIARIMDNTYDQKITEYTNFVDLRTREYFSVNYYNDDNYSERYQLNK